MTRTADFPAPTRVALGDARLEVFEAGRENRGNPIVLCHGWPEHAYSWRHQMPALAAAGYHVIVPNQRGYGNSSRPSQVEAYDIARLTGDLAALLDHFGYRDAVFVGHDWGANVVWSMALLHPARVRRIINLALPYQPRTPIPWVEFLEGVFGPDNHLVHFNRQPGVADAVLDANAGRFLRNLLRRNQPSAPPEPGMMMINLATAEAPSGDPLMSDEDLAVFIAAFEASGFAASINWYRNLDRNWRILADVDPVVRQPALMIHGTRDMIPPSETLSEFVPNAEVLSLDCGHWIQQEKPDETTEAMLGWLAVRQAA
ncbi:Pimeloyl-ACP methyl ester carboxylesterase [Albimonas donghaensis]|uniref:Pimeloyl-ACP methyl ester carboxylesterase n=1 Tax=Albimonas donghaensis TaxID=356660 RepID=A0A1H2RN02_9RHOB|nr:alpha/beta hydrolase [Albimonas donghaensis]SDW20846.1 Pimeloyl-ACP methyl ester carboxylesterase [Albimonas donghaensis]